MYLTYDEYQKMGGTLEETAFVNFEFEAESTINWYTFNRLANDTEFSENVKRLVFRLIELIQLNRKAHALGQDAQTGAITGAIASQSNDGFSTSYNVLNASSAIEVSASETKRLVSHYLRAEVNSLGQKLLYRGVYPNE